MNPERWVRVKEIYHSALDLEPGKREEFLEEACAGDESLFRDVTSLLAQEEKSGSLFESPALDVVAKALAEDQAQEPEDKLVGRALSHYRVEEKIGEGGMGEVYRARDTRLDRTVALKVLPAVFASDRDRMRRFIREARAASALSHASVATIYEVGESDGIHFIAMELIGGPTLSEWAGHRAVESRQAIEIGIQMADALEEAHAKGIIHRDIKPGNVMLTAKGQAKVLDFGLATGAGSTLQHVDHGTALSTNTGLVLGSVPYMSPEQALGQELDNRTDIFSLGAVLYELITGRLPFPGATSTQIMDGILHAEPEQIARINQKVPADFERIIGKCLEKDRGRRFQSAHEVLVALQHLKRDLDLSAHSRVHALLTSRRSLATVLTLVAILAGAAGWYWLVRRQPAEPETDFMSVPLTTYPGHEDTPSFSPDGTQVAFQWCTEVPNGNCSVYVKQIGIEPPFRLTAGPARDLNPAWSPDGRFIAFLRMVSPTRAALMVVSQRGGPERIVSEADWSDEFFYYRCLTWTPDSKSLVVSWPRTDQQSLALFNVETREMAWLTSSQGNDDTNPAFSPDGHSLAFDRSTSIGTDLYLLRVGSDYRPKEPPLLIASHGGALSIAWTSDGREILYSSGNALWRMAARPTAKPRRIALESQNAWSPAVSRQGNRLAYAVMRRDANIWRIDLQGPDLRAGPPQEFIASTREEIMPAYSADGKRIAFFSDRSGEKQVWVCDSDGANPTQLSSLAGIWGKPAWAPDGRNIALTAVVNGNADIYVLPVDGGPVRRMTAHPAVDKWPAWSRDGKWLYFTSSRKGGEIWKMPVVGGEAMAIQVTSKGGDAAQESPDGKFLYYGKGWPSQFSVWRMPVGGGNEEQVVGSVHRAGGWVVGEHGIYYFSAPDSRGWSDLRFYRNATGATSKLLTIEKPLDYCIAVSPDGRTVLYTQLDVAGSDLMLVENFR